MTRRIDMNDELDKKERLKEFCGTLTYPLYCLSIKTIEQNENGKKTYIPYQYSIHIEYSNGHIEHKEFIANEKIKTKEEFAKHLCKDIPLDSTILTNNITMDKMILDELSRCCFELSFHLLILSDNMRDLTLPFKENWHGLSHINEDYSFIDIQNVIHNNNLNKNFELGIEKNYLALLEEKDNKNENIKNTLLEDSKIDTLLMVEVLKKLRSV